MKIFKKLFKKKEPRYVYVLTSHKPFKRPEFLDIAFFEEEAVEYFKVRYQEDLMEDINHFGGDKCYKSFRSTKGLTIYMNIFRFKIPN